MEEEQDKVIIFPKWKDNLEQEAKLAMQENRYEEAYHCFRQLTDNGVHSHEVMTGKLICMMELDMQLEAELLCEELISHKDNHFAYYVHIYATLLFQMSKYKEVLYLIEDALEIENLPDPINGQLKQMYQLSKELQEQENKKSYQEIERQLTEALQTGNDRKQWYMIKRLIHLDIKEDKREFHEMLVNPKIHPVVKTGILEYFEKSHLHSTLHIEKFNRIQKIHVNEETDILPSSFVKGVSTYMEQIEQEDPIQYDMAQLILERFMYVYTPFLPQYNNYYDFANSLMYYVKQSFDTVEKDKIEKAMIKTEYIKMIDVSETLYGSILDI